MLQLNTDERLNLVSILHKYKGIRLNLCICTLCKPSSDWQTYFSSNSFSSNVFSSNDFSSKDFRPIHFVQSYQVRLGQIRLGQFRFGQVRIRRNGLDENRLDQNELDEKQVYQFFFRTTCMRCLIPLKSYRFSRKYSIEVSIPTQIRMSAARQE